MKKDLISNVQIRKKYIFRDNEKSLAECIEEYFLKSDSVLMRDLGISVLILILRQGSQSDRLEGFFEKALLLHYFFGFLKSWKKGEHLKNQMKMKN